MHSSAHGYAGRGTPAVCPLARALGKNTGCIARHCPWYQVPGTFRVCAVEQWSPEARHDPRIARWFARRAEETVEGRKVLASHARRKRQRVTNS
jgi:hypothetical protein